MSSNSKSMPIPQQRMCFANQPTPEQATPQRFRPNSSLAIFQQPPVLESTARMINLIYSSRGSRAGCSAAFKAVPKPGATLLNVIFPVKGHEMLHLLNCPQLKFKGNNYLPLGYIPKYTPNTYHKYVYVYILICTYNIHTNKCRYCPWYPLYVTLCIPRAYPRIPVYRILTPIKVPNNLLHVVACQLSLQGRCCPNRSAQCPPPGRRWCNTSDCRSGRVLVG